MTGQRLLTADIHPAANGHGRPEGMGAELARLFPDEVAVYGGVGATERLTGPAYTEAPDPLVAPLPASKLDTRNPDLPPNEPVWSPDSTSVPSGGEESVPSGHDNHRPALGEVQPVS